jgi:hypothetical protein
MLGGMGGQVLLVALELAPQRSRADVDVLQRLPSARRPHGGEDDRQRWFAEAVTAYAEILGASRPELPEHAPAGSVDLGQPILMLQAQALLAVLGPAPEGDRDDPRALSFEQVAAALAAWGTGAAPAGDLQERMASGRHPLPSSSRSLSPASASRRRKST